MVSSEVERTLVKSPPELWAELSDPAALARHLGQLGDIRITRTEPEKTVEWTAEHISGTVSIKPSGWGTTVKLTVTRESTQAPEAADSSTSTPVEDAAERSTPAQDPTSHAVETSAPEPAAEVAPEPHSEPERNDQPPAEPAPQPVAAVQPESRRSFFARLFGRRRRLQPAIELALAVEVDLAPSPVEAEKDPFEAVRRVLAPETFAGAHLFAPVQVAPAPPSPERASDIAAELQAAEEVDAEQVTALLTAVLDRLGAAHHRPFSRA
jgi:hypothetical protein